MFMLDGEVWFQTLILNGLPYDSLSMGARRLKCERCGGCAGAAIWKFDPISIVASWMG
jgi:hypothetical protein